MALIKKFCCGCNVRSGSIFAGFYCLVSSGLFVGLLCVRYVGYKLVDTSETYAIAAYATVALFMLLLATSITLVIGVYMDIQMLFVPWLVIVILCILEASGALVWYIISRLREEKTVPAWEIAITAYHVVNSIMLVYCMVCVISQLQDLMAGKGTSRYYRRRRQLRRQRLPPHITPVPIELIGDVLPGPETRPPPLGSGPAVPPPPYTDEPPPYNHQDPEDVGFGVGAEGGSQPPEYGEVGEEGAAGIGRSDLNATNDTDRAHESLESIDSPEDGSLFGLGNVNNGFERHDEGNSALPRFPPEPLASFHFGDVDLILPIPPDAPNANTREHSPPRRREASPRQRHKKKKKKKRNNRSRSNDRGQARPAHVQRPHAPQMHGRRPEGPRPSMPHIRPQVPPPPISPSVRPFPPSPRNSPRI